MTPSLLDQLSLAVVAAREISQEKSPSERRPAGSNSKRIYDAMTDGEVWHSARAAEKMGLEPSTARKALRRLCRQGVISHVGFDYPNGRPRALFRRPFEVVQ